MHSPEPMWESQDRGGVGEFGEGIDAGGQSAREQ